MLTYAKPIQNLELPADTVGVVIISTAGAVVAQDWPSGSKVAQFTAPVGFYLNVNTTSVAVPTTNQAGSTAPASGNVYVPPNLPKSFQIPGGSSGYSITGGSSGVVSAEFWSK